MLNSANRRNNFRDFILILFRFEDVAVSYSLLSESPSINNQEYQPKRSFDMSENNLYDVVIIGGGITGAGTARDCAMRGLKVLLVEKRDFTNGATGRNHGLLHSGARYAVTDQESAKECIQ